MAVNRLPLPGRLEQVAWGPGPTQSEGPETYPQHLLRAYQRFKIHA